MDEKQVEISQKQIQEDKPVIKELLHLVDLQEPKFSTTDYLYNIDLYGIDEYGTAYLIQHKVMCTENLCFEVDYSVASKKFELHAVKATHFAVNHDGRLYIFDVMIMNQVIKNHNKEWEAGKTKKKLKDGSFQYLVWVSERDFLKAYTDEFFKRCNLKGFGWFDFEEVKRLRGIEDEEGRREFLNKMLKTMVRDYEIFSKAGAGIVTYGTGL